MKKRIFAIVLCLVMALTSVNFAFATEGAVEGTVGETAATVALTDDEAEGSMIGKTVWIKAGTTVYKDYKHTDKNYYKTSLPHKIRIVEEVKEEESVEWYKFDFIDGTNFWPGMASYKYVKVDGTTEKEPSDTDEPVLPEDKEVITEDGNTVTVEGAPQNTTLTIDQAAESDMNTIIEYISDQNGSDFSGTPLFAYDITLVDKNGDIWQPGDDPVEVSLKIPGLELKDDETVQIMHLHEGNVEVIEPTIMEDGETICFEATGFSTYAGFTGTGVLVDGSYFYNMATATSVNLSTILTAIGVTKKAKEATSVTPQIDGKETNLITATQNSAKDNWSIARPSALMEQNVKLHVVFGDKTNIDITITDQGYKYYLTGTKWDFGEGTENVNVTPSGVSETVALKVNEAPLRESDMENHKTTYVKSVEGASVPAAYGTIHLLIYMRAGEALKVNTGTYFPYGSWSAADYEAGKYHKNGWEWVYTADDGTGTAANYIVTDEVSEVTVADIQFRDSAADNDKKWIVNAKLIIIPQEDEPTLVRETLNDDTYDVRKLPITLYNYDGAAFNDYYKQKNNGYYLGFANYSKGELAAAETSLPWNTTTEFPKHLPNSGDISTGIMKNTLENGVPVANSTANTDFFSTTEFAGKDVIENVGFEFLYNNDTGYYTYSSNLNHAQYNDTNKTIELYNETLAPAFDVNICNTTYANLQNTRAGFYPFGNIQDAFMNAKDPTDGVEYVSWRDKIEIENESGEIENVDATSHEYFQQNALYAQDPVRTASIEPMSSMDMHFGLHLNADFYMPTGSSVDVNKDGEMEDLIYSFTGDDDLWVYVDGKLALDIGGAHTAVSGTINFTKKTVTLGDYAIVTANGNEWTVGETKEETGKAKAYTFAELGLDVAEDRMHTLQIFYLERWSGESNCRMHFNLPLIPSDSVNVSKNLVNQDDEEMSVTPDVEYTYTLYTANNGDDEVNADSFTAYANAEYTVAGSDAPEGIQKTNNEGQFKLKDGWTASFEGISRFTEVYVVESNPEDGYVYAGSTVSVNKAAPDDYTYGEKTETKVMQLNSSINFDFVNKMQTQPLKIEKQVANGTEGLLDPANEFSFTLDFIKQIEETGEDAIKATKANSEVALTDGEEFKLKHGESITIPRVPVNMTYTVSEANPDKTNNSFDAPVFTATKSTFTAETIPNEFAFDTAYEWKMADGGLNEIDVKNQQRFDLVIEKSGISDVDNHEKNNISNAEYQTTLFEVTGPNNFHTQVAIKGNSSKKIVDLPVGVYTVKELKDWSWRYELEEGAIERTVDPDAVEETVLYKNARPDIFWLNGGAYKENVFR